jgi:hypothetical protein
MTPEELEALPGIDPETVEAIQTAVNGYYGQFEESVEEPAVPEAPVETAEQAAPEEHAEAASEPENESVTIDNAESSEQPK